MEISTTHLSFSWLMTVGCRRGIRRAAPKIVRVRQSDLHSRAFGLYGSGSKIWYSFLTHLGSLVFFTITTLNTHLLKLVWCEFSNARLNSHSIAPRDGYPCSVTVELSAWNQSLASGVRNNWLYSILNIHCLLSYCSDYVISWTIV